MLFLSCVLTAVALTASEPPPADPPSAETTTRSHLDRLLTAYRANDLATAETEGRQALLVASERFESKHPLMVEANLLLGSVLRARGKFDDGRPILATAIKGLEGKPVSEQLATAHFQSGLLERAAGRADEALAHLGSSLGAYEAVNGPGSGSAIAAAEMLAETQSAFGRHEAALATYRTFLPHQSKALGSKHPRYGRNLARYGLALAASGQDPDALEQLTLALAIFREAPPGPSVSVILMELGTITARQGDHRATIGHLLEALETADGQFHPDSPHRSRLYGNLGMAWVKIGDMTAARSAFDSAVEIDRRRDGEDSPKLLISLGNLAYWYRRVGDIYGAIPVHEAVLLQARRHAPASLNLAISLDNLALMLSEAGEYDRSRLLYEEAETLLMALSKSADMAVSLSTNVTGQAQLLKYIGDADGALAYAKRALTLFESRMGADHPQMGVLLDNYATMLSDKRRYDEAIGVFQRALAIHERGGLDSPAVATNLNNTAWVFGQLGRNRDALPLYERAVAISEKRLGKNHALVSAATAALGITLVDLGESKRGLALLRDAAKRAATVLGPTHPWVAERRSSLALGLLSTGDQMGAAREAGLALAAVEANVDALMYGTSERERLRLVAERRPKLDLFVGLKTTSAEAAYDAVIRWKAAVLSSLVSQRRSVVAEADPALKERLLALADVRATVATLSVAIVEPDEAPAAAERLSAMRKKKEELERELSRASRSFADMNQRQSMGRVDVCKRLEANDVLLDFVRYRSSASKADGGIVRQDRYAAFIVSRADCKRVARVDLGSAMPIETAIEELRGTLENQDDADDVIDAGRTLRTLVWDPLVAEMGSPKRIFVVPDAALHSIPFQAFPIGERTGAEDARFLVERYIFVYLSTAKDLLAQAPEVATDQRALIVGGVNYDGEGAPVAVAATSRGAGCGLGRQLAFGFLPGSDAEAKAVAQKLGAAATTLSGAAATEDAVSRALGSATMVHLATHGYFAAGCKSATAPGFVAGMPSSGAIGVNPLVLSGIALAGANRPRRADSPGGSVDGILTAEEVAGLDLSKLELAVLSACETGLGDVKTGEGVLGLRWAFQVAGARSLVMSLWKVPDNETRRLMTALHQALARGEPASVALRSAQLRLLETLRQDGDSNPWLWAAFIASGR